MKVLELQKFPQIFVGERPLVWDSRQSPLLNELILVPDTHITEDLRQKLRQRSGHHITALGQGGEIEIAEPRKYLAELCAKYFDFPSSKLVLWGVTGTNGKSTCAALLRRVCVEAGFKTAEIGTLGISIWSPGQSTPDLHVESGYTTPDAPQLQKLMADFVAAGVSHVVMEVSSHAIELGRVWALDFAAMLFTNLSQDHLDFHGTMERYAEAKSRAFTEVLPGLPHFKQKKLAVLNTADPLGNKILSKMPPQIQCLDFGLEQNISISRVDADGIAIRHTPGGETLQSPLVGRFNAENLAGVLRLCIGAGIPLHTIQIALAHFSGARGRMERIFSPNSSKKVFVDFAHSPAALENALLTLRSLLSSQQKLWVVVGCGGDRDASKRPIMGRIASEVADQVILTSDNPRTEDPESIVSQILAGVSPNLRAKVTVQVDRKAAISMAIQAMGAQDFCLIAGKGHEEYQIVGQQKLPFSDQALCRSLLA